MKRRMFLLIGSFVGLIILIAAIPQPVSACQPFEGSNYLRWYDYQIQVDEVKLPQGLAINQLFITSSVTTPIYLLTHGTGGYIADTDFQLPVGLTTTTKLVLTSTIWLPQTPIESYQGNGLVTKAEFPAIDVSKKFNTNQPIFVVDQYSQVNSSRPTPVPLPEPQRNLGLFLFNDQIITIPLTTTYTPSKDYDIIAYQHGERQPCGLGFGYYVGFTYLLFIITTVLLLISILFVISIIKKSATPQNSQINGGKRFLSGLFIVMVIGCMVINFLLGIEQRRIDEKINPTLASCPPDCSNRTLSREDYYDDWSHVDFSHASLKNLSMYQWELYAANLQHADIRKSSLEQANLVKADLRGADLRDANLAQADLRDVITDEKTQLDPKWQMVIALLRGERPSLAGVDLGGAKLINVDLSNMDLRGANLEKTTLDQVKLRGADLRGVNLAYAVGTTVDLRDVIWDETTQVSLAPDIDTLIHIHNRKPYEITINLADADLASLDLTSYSFENIDLHSANISNSNLQNVNLQGANLGFANLQNADLRGANLANANLEGANLIGANLDGANLTQANLLGVNAANASFQYIRVRLNAIPTTLIAADLTNANLSHSDWRNVNLSGAILSGAQMDEAVFAK